MPISLCGLGYSLLQALCYYLFYWVKTLWKIVRMRNLSISKSYLTGSDSSCFLLKQLIASNKFTWTDALYRLTKPSYTCTSLPFKCTGYRFKCTAIPFNWTKVLVRAHGLIVQVYEVFVQVYEVFVQVYGSLVHLNKSVIWNSFKLT